MLIGDATMEDEARVPERYRTLMGKLAVLAGAPVCGNTCDCAYFGQKCHLLGSGVEQHYAEAGKDA